MLGNSSFLKNSNCTLTADRTGKSLLQDEELVSVYPRMVQTQLSPLSIVSERSGGVLAYPNDRGD